LTPHVRASTGVLGLLVTGSFHGTMMGGGACDWLKTGRIGAKTAKQAEIHLADLQKILSIVRAAGGDGPRGGRLTPRYRFFPVKMANGAQEGVIC
jgi:hypothetical protein